MWAFGGCRRALRECASRVCRDVGATTTTTTTTAATATAVVMATVNEGKGVMMLRRGIATTSAAMIKPRRGGDGSKLKPYPRGAEAPLTSFEAGAKQVGWGSAGGGAAPWTPTRELKKRKSYFKRCGHIMETLEREHMKELAAKRAVVPFRPGDVVKLTLEVPENRRRTQTFTGICIAKRHRGMGSSFTLRSAMGNLAVERSFPLYSPNIKGFEVLERRKVRRAKLYYLRDKPLRFSRVD